MVRSLLSGVGRGIAWPPQNLVRAQLPRIKWAWPGGRVVEGCLMYAGRAWMSALSVAEQCSPVATKVDMAAAFAGHTASEGASQLFLQARFIRDVCEAFEEESQGAIAARLASTHLRTAKVVLCGWVSHVRFVNESLIFVVAKDRTGTIQLVLTPGDTDDFEGIRERLRRSHKRGLLEATIAVEGHIKRRPDAMHNGQMASGSVEVFVRTFIILNEATRLPFNPNHLPMPDEEFRMRYRYVDLRRTALQRSIMMRSKANAAIRSFMERNNFVEVETPVLFKRTPEGAREFVIKTSVKGGPGEIEYALPQSPQQFKQMLMAAGFGRYYQIARCFRDEQLRSDRQPEFTQLDMEMSFVSADQVMNTMEELVVYLWQTMGEGSLVGGTSGKFPRLTYASALATYGSDKPDLRYPWKLRGRSDHLGARAEGEILEETLTVGSFGSSGEDSHFTFPIDALTREHWRLLAKLIEPFAHQIQVGGNILLADLIAGSERVVDGTASGGSSSRERTISFTTVRRARDHVGSTVLGRIRQHIIRCIEQQPEVASLHRRATFAPLWVVDFPLLKEVKDGGDEEGTADAASASSGAPFEGPAFASMHHPFTAPHSEDLCRLAVDPLSVRGQHYDLVINGSEVGGGSIRIHSASLQLFILSTIMKVPASQIEHFGHLFGALSSGCPPHGGMALGLDRLMAILLSAATIRDVIAFPKNSAGVDLCVQTPVEH